MGREYHPLVDTHCHLYDERSHLEPAEIVELARQSGVDRMIVIGIDGPSSEASIRLAERFEGVYATVGWHPTEVASFQRGESIAKMRDWVMHPKVVAIGEIGLDYYWDKTSPEEQEAALFPQLDLAAELGLPVVFHCREAYDALLGILERRNAPPFVFHCFGGNQVQAERAIAMGGYLGVDGPITYKKNEALRELFAWIPEDRILIETDAPYLSPEPFRGKPNHPGLVALVNEKLAQVRGLTVEECARITTENAERLFRFPGPSVAI